MGCAPDGEPFRCDHLDELWASHQKKLETVHSFLVQEPCWFDVQPPDPNENAVYLVIIMAWARHHDRSKQRGFYVDLSKTWAGVARTDVADQEALRDVIARVHQIGWQLRPGEHRIAQSTSSFAMRSFMQEGADESRTGYESSGFSFNPDGADGGSSQPCRSYTDCAFFSAIVRSAAAASASKPTARKRRRLLLSA